MAYQDRATLCTHVRVIVKTLAFCRSRLSAIDSTQFIFDCNLFKTRPQLFWNETLTSCLKECSDFANTIPIYIRRPCVADDEQLQA